MEYILTLILEDGSRIDWKELTGFLVNPVAETEREMKQLLACARQLNPRVVDAEWKAVAAPHDQGME